MLDNLDVFAGRWQTEGRQLQSTVGPAAPVTALQTYEWLPGRHFMLHRFEGRVGQDDASCLEVIGFEPQRRCFEIHTFYNNGVKNRWEMSVSGPVWNLTGNWNGAPVTCTITLSDSGQELTSVWQMSGEPFWDLSSTRV